MNHLIKTLFHVLILSLQNEVVYSRINSSNKNSFQLRLFWEEGMIWQGNTNERSWCAECEGNCEEGEYIEIKECNDRKMDQKWILNKNKFMPLSNTDVCFTVIEGREKIKLQNCDDNNDNILDNNNGNNSTITSRTQLFSGVNKKREFQIHPLNNKNLCLTQHHHPKSGERLMVTSCLRAEANDANKYDDTSRWDIGTFEGHDSILFLDWFDNLGSITKHFGHRNR